MQNSIHIPFLYNKHVCQLLELIGMHVSAFYPGVLY